MWYKYTAYNQETHYGWSRKKAVAEAALELINKGRELNRYNMTCLGDDENEADGGSISLAERGGWLFNDDTSLEDFLGEG